MKVFDSEISYHMRLWNLLYLVLLIKDPSKTLLQTNKQKRVKEFINERIINETHL